MQVQLAHSGGSIEVDYLFVGQSLFIHILAYAAGRIAAHQALGAVGIEHTHAEVGHSGRPYEHKSVGADAKMAVAQAHGQSAGVGNGETRFIYIDVVVAQTFHFGKLQIHPKISKKLLDT